jgi:Zn-dependent protease with chaperone function
MEKITLPIKKNNVDYITPSNPDFKWLFKMLIIIIPFIIISYLLFYLFAYFVIWSISIQKEKELFGNINNKKTIFNINNKLKNKIPKKYLKNTNIYLENNNEVNAYAMLWWDIIVTTSLLSNIKYEEELIFIIWHEMQHIKNRDVLKNLLTNIPFYLTLKFIWFNVNNQILNATNNYKNKYTELTADNWWIELINKMWLNLDCSLEFFKRDNWKFNNYFLLLSDHPTNDKRIENLEKHNLNKDKKCNIFTYNKKD